MAELLKNATELIPIALRILFTRPLAESSWVTIPEIITHDRKLGRYNRVCVILRTLLLRNSFRKIARNIGIGNPIIKSPRFRIRVFFSAPQKSLDENTSLKLDNPIHGLLQIP